ncbi:NAD(P)/FAD-dependent oxidoreductase [Litchfieldia salsa]|uniref:Thioredoxin reductase n=1 Tax=Litchfieldia salsa TaxID=930152 RepID=A0A1H0TFQ1_9BACI|nr:NAD(P)/FAD-dependent oxidoreductase [Litchfieldia salsa]SDP52500.1 Thioredoxin reductase [Litchfieldia salsa]
METTYDCIVIGGGIAGLQASIQLGRYQHKTTVIDSNHGRSTLCRNYHNILGWPNGVSGETLRSLGRMQAESYGVNFLADTVTAIKDQKDFLEVSCESGRVYKAKKVLLATGVMDRLPEITHILPCLGLSIYVCPDCDGYEVINKRTVVLGSGSTGANLAITLLQWTNSVTYINHDGVEINQELKETLANKEIEYINEPIESVQPSENPKEIESVTLVSGKVINAEKGFIGFGGNKVKTDLVKELSVERMENKHIIVDSRTKRTSHPRIWAAGDIAVHSEQVTIAMGDGMQAAIWIHKSLLKEG